MSKTIELTDEQYCIVEYAAQARGKPVEALVEAWIEEVRDRDRFPRYYETDDWLRHLGVSEERIERANRKLAAKEARKSNADAR